MTRIALMLLLLAPLGCVDAAQVHGAPMPPGAAQPVAAALAGFEDDEAAPRKFSGRVTEVCQAEGCWLILEDGGKAARVMMKDHAFAVPKDARGAAVVFGTLSARTLDEKTARHLADDAGKDVPLPQREYRIVATSVELQGG
jgi:hypothetical protein